MGGIVQSGIAGAVEKAVAAAREAAAAAAAAPIEDLLPLPELGGGEATRPGGGKRGRGRPAGAVNRRTREIVEYLGRRYRSPLEALAVICTRPTRVLAAELGLSSPSFDQLMEVLKMQISASTALAPYMHSRQPIDVNLDPTGIVEIVIQHRGGADFQKPGDGRVIDVRPLDEKADKSDG